MKPNLEGTAFGWIDVDGKRIKHDILIRLDGTVEKRKKKLSKEIYGTSHKISQAEAEFIYQDGAAVLLIGGGQFGRIKLSPEAKAFFAGKNIDVRILTTPQAAKAWNISPVNTIGLFHITC